LLTEHQYSIGMWCNYCSIKTIKLKRFPARDPNKTSIQIILSVI
jgi:hypothetical protein